MTVLSSFVLGSSALRSVWTSMETIRLGLTWRKREIIRVRSGGLCLGLETELGMGRISCGTHIVGRTCFWILIRVPGGYIWGRETIRGSIGLLNLLDRLLRRTTWSVEGYLLVGAHGTECDGIQQNVACCLLQCYCMWVAGAGRSPGSECRMPFFLSSSTTACKSRKHHICMTYQFIQKKSMKLWPRSSDWEGVTPIQPPIPIPLKWSNAQTPPSLISIVLNHLIIRNVKYQPQKYSFLAIKGIIHMFKSQRHPCASLKSRALGPRPSILLQFR